MVKMNNSERKISNYNWEKLGLELLVVFLGITAGFILNNWRQRQQNEKLEQKYIEGFIQDVSENIKELEKSVSLDSMWMLHAKPLLKEMKDRTITTDSALAAMKLISSMTTWDAHTVTYEDITNSGHLNLIGNFGLKNRIVDYYGDIQGAKHLDDNFYNYDENYIMPFIMNQYSILRQQLSDPGIMKTVHFSNIFAGYYVMIMQQRKSYSKLLAKSRSLKNELIRYGNIPAGQH